MILFFDLECLKNGDDIVVPMVNLFMQLYWNDRSEFSPNEVYIVTDEITDELHDWVFENIGDVRNVFIKPDDITDKPSIRFRPGQYVV